MIHCSFFLSICFIGVVTEFNARTSDYTITFDNDFTDATNVSLDKVEVYMQKSDVYSVIGVIQDIHAMLIADASPYTVDAFLCSTNKINDISILFPYEFSSGSFNFDGEQIGDSIMIDKDNFEDNCSTMGFEIVACDHDGNLYVSVFILCYFKHI